MAVTLDEAKLFVRLDGLDDAADDAADDAELQKMVNVATEVVERRAPAAPESVRDEAVLRVVSALYDERGITGGENSRPISHAAMFQSSGALALVKPWVVRRVLS